jgi:hypothetical protein
VLSYDDVGKVGKVPHGGVGGGGGGGGTVMYRKSTVICWKSAVIRRNYLSAQYVLPVTAKGIARTKYQILKMTNTK